MSQHPAHYGMLYENASQQLPHVRIHVLLRISNTLNFKHVCASLFEPRADHQHNEIALFNKAFIDE